MSDETTRSAGAGPAQEYADTLARACGCTRLHAMVAFTQVFDRIRSSKRGKLLLTRNGIDTLTHTTGFAAALETTGLLTFNASGECSIFVDGDKPLEKLYADYARRRVAVAEQVLNNHDNGRKEAQV